MATWEDGPEYAPRERPAGFAAPEIAALDVAPPRQELSAGAPVQRPVFEQRHQVSPLTEHRPETGPQRDPQQAFEIASSVMTDSSASAWGAAHSGFTATSQPDPGWAPPSGAPAGTPPAGPSGALPAAPGVLQGVPHPGEVAGPPTHDPHQAFHLTGGQRQGLDFPPPEGAPAGQPGPEQLADYPAPGSPQWFGPGQQPQPQQRRPSVGGVLEGVTFPTAVALLIGGLCVMVDLFGWLSPLAFLTAFLTSGRIGYRRTWVRYLFLAGTAALVVTLVVGVLSSLDDLLVAYDLLSQLSAVVCWLVLIALIVLVAKAQSRGEQPQQPNHNPDPGWG